MAATKRKRRPLTWAMDRLLRDALKAIEGPDMAYYACRGCHLCHVHDKGCVAMRIIKRIQEK